MVTASALAMVPAAAADPPTEQPLCQAPYQGAAALTADPANPLGLTPAPGPDPLTGAKFYVPGPGYGHAAGAIAQLLKDNGLSTMSPTYGTESWATFRAALLSPPLSGEIAAKPALANDIALLMKIADQPETARFSIYSAGGGPGAVYSQVQKYLCRINKPPSTGPYAIHPSIDASVPGQRSLPLISTYFLIHTSPCSTLYLTADQIATFKRQVTEFAHGMFGWAAVVLDEIDALDTAPCLSLKGLTQRLQLLRWMVDEIHKDDPHVVQYVEGGAADAECVWFAIDALKYIDGTSNVVSNPYCGKPQTKANAKHHKPKPKPNKKHGHHPSADGSASALG
jgi:hypothetical protein